MQIDYNGVATLLVALGGFITTVGTFAMQVISFNAAQRLREEQAIHKQTLDQINSKVDTIVKADTTP